jgi:hypothetical protein
MLSSTACDSFWMSDTVSKCRPFSFIFNLGNKAKSCPCLNLNSGHPAHTPSLYQLPSMTSAYSKWQHAYQGHSGSHNDSKMTKSCVWLQNILQTDKSCTFSKIYFHTILLDPTLSRTCCSHLKCLHSCHADINDSRSLIPQCRVLSIARHDIITTCCGVPGCARILHCLTFSFIYRIYMKPLHFALSSLIDIAANFNVIHMTNLLDHVLLFEIWSFTVVFSM